MFRRASLVCRPLATNFAQGACFREKRAEAWHLRTWGPANGRHVFSDPFSQPRWWGLAGRGPEKPLRRRGHMESGGRAPRGRRRRFGSRPPPAVRWCRSQSGVFVPSGLRHTHSIWQARSRRLPGAMLPRLFAEAWHRTAPRAYMNQRLRRLRPLSRPDDGNRGPCGPRERRHGLRPAAGRGGGADGRSCLRCPATKLESLQDAQTDPLPPGPS